MYLIPSPRVTCIASWNVLESWSQDMEVRKVFNVALVVRVVVVCPQQWLKATKSSSVFEPSTRTMGETPSLVPTATSRDGRDKAVFVLQL